MLAYFLRRIALTIPTFLALMFLTFVAIRLVPGDPVEVRMGEHGMSPERLAYFRHELGLDQPVWRQFLDYVWRLAHGDFGVSLVDAAEGADRVPDLVSGDAGTVVLRDAVCDCDRRAGRRDRGGQARRLLRSGADDDIAVRLFDADLLVGPAAHHVRLGEARLLPVSGRIDLINYSFDQPTGFMTIDALLSDQPGAFLDALRHLILPAIVLGTVPLAVIARMTRSSMLEVLSEDYVRTARAKGLSPARVIGVHALRNALLPVVTVIGLSVSSLMAGAVLTETIFSWPGVGHWLIESISRRDYPALQGGVLLVSAVVVLVNLIVDLVYGIIDPRIRHGR